LNLDGYTVKYEDGFVSYEFYGTIKSPHYSLSWVRNARRSEAPLLFALIERDLGELLL